MKYISTILIFIAVFVGNFHHKVQAQGDILFVKNKGQWSSNIDFKAELSGGYAFLEKDGFTFVMDNTPNHAHFHDVVSKEKKEITGRFAYKMKMVNSKKSINYEGRLKQSFVHNYFLGNDKSKWKSNVPVYKEVRYKEVYESIDLVVRSNTKLLEYDFVVKPGGDAKQIQLDYEGLESINLVQGQLHLKTPLGTVTELAPVVYVKKDGQKKQIKAAFRLNNDKKVSFDILEDYDKSAELIIDPVLVFSTYTGSFSDNWGFTATYDSEGNLYAGGITRSNGYPTTTGALDTTYNGGFASSFPTDIVISKFGPNGKELLYSTYLGGVANELPHSLIVNSKDELVILGTSGSTNFPVTNNAFDQVFNGANYMATDISIDFPVGSEIIVCKLNSQGNVLLGSTFFGGTSEDGLNVTGPGSLEYNYGDFARGDIYIDENDDIYIASSTFSNDIPNTGNSFGSAAQGGLDALVARFDPTLTSLKWATYLGGSSNDAAYSIDFADNELVISGGTSSADFNGLNGLNSTYQGGVADGFVIKLGLDGQSSSAGTYLGTNAYDQSYFVEIDGSGAIYCYGQTLGDYPVTPGKYTVSNAAQFIHKLSADLENTEYSLTFGSPHNSTFTKSVNISPTAFLIDKCENLYAIGWGGLVNNNRNFSAGFTDNMETTTDAYSRTTDGSDFYLMVLNQGATELEYATYFGEPGDRFAGTGREHVDGGTSRFDKDGFVYHAVCASCGNTDGFPTTDDAWSATNNSSNCNMAVFKFEFDRAPIRAQLEGSPASGCPPLRVNFKNVSNRPGEDFYWNFDDGTTSNLENPTHTFTEQGEYNVQFVIVDSANCIIADTGYFLVSVNSENDTTLASFTENIDKCNTLSVAFENQSQNASSYLWDFGDGETSNEFEPSHVYAEPGNYDVTLIVQPGSICSDTLVKTLSLTEKNLQATIVIDPMVCNNPNVSFSALVDSSITASSYFWEFGDGDTSNLANPTHSYDSISIDYQVVLTVTDIDGCETKTSQVLAIPNINFDFMVSSLNPCAPLNSPINFTLNGTSSSQLIATRWDFGDGTIFSNQLDVNHTYINVGVYDVVFAIQNSDGCSDTTTKSVTIDNNIEFSYNESYKQLSCNAGNLLTSFQSGVEIDGDSIDFLTWNFGDGTIITNDSVDLSHQYADGGNFEVELLVQSMLGCKDSISFPVLIEKSNSVAALDDLVICRGDSVTVELIISGDADYDLKWMPNRGISNDTIVNPTLYPTETTTYIYEINSVLQSGLICTINDSFEVKVDTNLSVSATANPMIVKSMETSQLNASDGFINYSWSPADLVSDPSSSNSSTEELTMTTTFVVNANNGNSCSATDTVIVVVEDRNCDFQSIFIPTAFSPNGDQLNDVFRIQSEASLDRYELRIYSRWGDVVFESHDIKEFWDGKFKDQLLSTDAFGYVLEVECNGEIKNYQGNITLVR